MDVVVVAGPGENEKLFAKAKSEVVCSSKAAAAGVVAVAKATTRSGTHNDNRKILSTQQPGLEDSAEGEDDPSGERKLENQIAEIEKEIEKVREERKEKQREEKASEQQVQPEMSMVTPRRTALAGKETTMRAIQETRQPSNKSKMLGNRVIPKILSFDVNKGGLSFDVSLPRALPSEIGAAIASESSSMLLTGIKGTSVLFHSNFIANSHVNRKQHSN